MASKSASTLLRGGRVLQFDVDKNATFPVLDILMENGIIAKIDSHIAAGPHTAVIDVTGKIVCPGLVDSHRHLFQSHTRTSVANQTLLEYCGHLLFGRVLFYTPRDVYLAQLGAAHGADADDRVEGSLATAVAAMVSGAGLIRVHDVAVTVQAARLYGPAA